MPTSFVSKTPSSISLPDGSYCALYNEKFNGSSVYYYLDKERTEKNLYTKLDMSTHTNYRCLQYKIYFDQFSYKSEESYVVPYIKKDEEDNSGAFISQPLFECISPVSTYLDKKGIANVLFWTNLKEGVASFKVDTETGQYIYDEEQVWKIKQDEINNFSFQTGTVTRVLCSMSIEFKQLYIKYGDISDGLTIAPKTLVPVIRNIVVLQQIKADSPVLDFSTGGGGGTTTTNSRHAHTNNSDCGFAFAVFHPGTGVPLGNPWKN